MTAFSTTFLTSMKAVLEGERARLEEELKSIGHPTGVGADFEAEVPSYGDKDDENAAEVAEYSKNLTLERTLERELDDVLKALKRIEEDAYGICKYCKNFISEERLRARPTSASCVACKKTLTQEA